MSSRRLQPELPACGVLAVSHSHSRDFRTAVHWHGFFSLFYVIAGKGLLEITDNAGDTTSRIELSADSAVLLEPGAAHRIIDKPRNPMTLFVIYFAHENGGKKTAALDIAPLRRKPVKPGAYPAGEIRKNLRKILNEQSQRMVGCETAIISSLNEILVELLRASQNRGDSGDSAQQRVKAILGHIEHNFAQPYSLPDAAAEANLCQRHFTNLCRRLTGRSFHKYVEDVRLDRAMELLRKTAMPAAAIAFEVGYEELSTFYRAFKAKYGLSPIAYRNQ